MAQTNVGGASSANDEDLGAAILSERLQAIAEATQAVVAECDAIGISQNLRSTLKLPSALLKGNLAIATLDDLLLACEALVAISEPEALAMGDASDFKEQTRHLQKVIQGIIALGRGRAPVSVTAPMPVMSREPQAMSLREVALSGAVLAAFEHLAAQLAAVTTLRPSVLLAHTTPAVFRTRRALLPSPVFVAVLALLMFSVGSLAVGAAHVPPHLRVIPVFHQATTTVGPQSSTTITATKTGVGTPQTSTPNPTVNPNGGTPPAGNITPTPTFITPTPTTAPVVDVVNVSPLNTPLCPDAWFTITYASGAGDITWVATSPDPQNIGVGISSDASDFGQVSGVISPGQTTTVYAQELNDGSFSGQLSVTFSASIAGQAVLYTTGSCLAGG